MTFIKLESTRTGDVYINVAAITALYVNNGFTIVAMHHAESDVLVKETPAQILKLIESTGDLYEV